MSLLLLIPLSIGLGLIGLAGFFWALRNDQFDDPVGAAWRVISPETPSQTEGNEDDKLAVNIEDRHAGRRV
ncbi:cbb3-type cytochrome oxidase assembly protein CcoS [Maritimibacter sp. 55A14]|uniref:cbb3-type cytochrome oxidase assembly protein CcoS n=1 Tax=Maritimibacter sp. 55A14 TaxID=2174844 RepID=UPI000D60E49A|nr:cbb3-type cytochrome oxidase assembly protein CcoS [Maritimibacter sp. 55A14]PWE31261.1 cbb3-type cytochrome oxidase assembly protein CcoS [Maritimibacter sp. 55A14]